MAKPTPKPEPLSIRAYAKRRGVSHQAVMKAIARGRLRNSLTWNGGVARIADPELADREWKANTDLTRAHDDVKEKAAKSNGVVEELEPQPHGGALKRNRAVDDLPFIDTDDDAQTLAGASAREKHWRAELAALKYKQAAGELVDAAEMSAQLVDVFTTCRTRLMAIPSKAKTQLPHLSLQDLAVIETIVREALEDLANPIAEVSV